jgi:hypothetical protein
MTDPDEAARLLILARLAESRAELRRILDPPRNEPNGSVFGGGGGGHDGFPRSRTMQMLMSGRGLGVLGAVAAGLFIARPALALRLLRMLPAGAAARIFLLRALAQLRAKHQPNVTNP